MTTNSPDAGVDTDSLFARILAEEAKRMGDGEMWNLAANYGGVSTHIQVAIAAMRRVATSPPSREETIILSEESWNKFIADCENPPRANEKLKRLFREYAEWEKSARALHKGE